MSKQPFRLLDLLPELLNNVYVQLFQGSETTIRLLEPAQRLSWTFEHNPEASDKYDGLPGILSVNKQARGEALGIFYATTKWHTHEHLDVSVVLQKLGLAKSTPTNKVCFRKEVQPEELHQDSDTRYQSIERIASHWWVRLMWELMKKGLSIDEQPAEIEVRVNDGSAALVVDKAWYRRTEGERL